MSKLSKRKKSLFEELEELSRDIKRLSTPDSSVSINISNDYSQYVLGQPTPERYTRAEAKQIAPIYLKQFGESAKIIDKTTNPETFFYRFGFSLQRLTELEKMQKLVKFTGSNPSEIKQKMITGKQECIRQLIDRMTDKLEDKLSSLKTEKAIANNIIKFNNELEKYRSEMDTHTLAYKETVINSLKDKYNINVQLPNNYPPKKLNEQFNQPPKQPYNQSSPQQYHKQFQEQYQTPKYQQPPREYNSNFQQPFSQKENQIEISKTANEKAKKVCITGLAVSGLFIIAGWLRIFAILVFLFFSFVLITSSPKLSPIANKSFAEIKSVFANHKNLIISIGVVILGAVFIVADHAFLGLLAFLIGGILATINLVKTFNKNAKTPHEKFGKSIEAVALSLFSLFIILMIAVANAPVNRESVSVTSPEEAVSQFETTSSAMKSIVTSDTESTLITDSKEKSSKTESKVESNSKAESKFEKNENSSIAESSSKSESKSSSKNENSSKTVSENSSKTESTSKNSSLSEPIEMNTLQTLFTSLNSSMNRDDIDEYITSNKLMKYAFTWDSAYQIGYDYQAITQRGRDREGEAVDINFDNDGNIKSAKYTVHTGFDTQYHLKYENDVFYYNNQECDNGTEAMQKYLLSKNATESEIESKAESVTSSKDESKSESKSESKVESKQESKPESKIESKTESKVQSVAPQPVMQSYVFICNTDSMCYHTHECQAAKKILPEHRLDYTVNSYSKGEAMQYIENQGYWLCGICGR